MRDIIQIWCQLLKKKAYSYNIIFGYESFYKTNKYYNTNVDSTQGTINVMAYAWYQRPYVRVPGMVV